MKTGNKKQVMYNDMPITLTKSYAKGELKRSEDFVKKLTEKINSDSIKDENKNQAIEILNRRQLWVKALQEYLTNV
jgi:hypothetical protein